MLTIRFKITIIVININILGLLYAKVNNVWNTDYGIKQ